MNLNHLTFSEMDEDPPTVNKWDGNAIKNALDDATKSVSYCRHYIIYFFLVEF